MISDNTPEEMIEATLCAAGVDNPGDIANAIVEGLRDAELLNETADPITPTEGDYDDRQHMGFILRIFMHFVELTPNKIMNVNLNDVMASTTGRQMQVRLDGEIFEARTIAGPIVEEKPRLLI